MKKYNSILKKYILTISFVLFSLFHSNVFSSNQIMNFLPMEDAYSAHRNTTEDSFVSSKPHRDVFYYFENPTEKPSQLPKVDILAFILLGSVYFFIVHRNSKSNNISL